MNNIRLFSIQTGKGTIYASITDGVPCLEWVSGVEKVHLTVVKFNRRGLTVRFNIAGQGFDMHIPASVFDYHAVKERVERYYI